MNATYEQHFHNYTYMQLVSGVPATWADKGWQELHLNVNTK